MGSIRFRLHRVLTERNQNRDHVQKLVDEIGILSKTLLQGAFSGIDQEMGGGQKEEIPRRKQ